MMENMEKQIVRTILKGVKRVVLQGLSFLSRLLIRWAQWARVEFDLYDRINRQYSELHLGKDASKDIEQIFDKPITHLDVGARGGLLDIVAKYRRFFDVILCEPGREEAEVLRAKGYKVIGKPLWRQEGEVPFYEVALPAAASIYEPPGPFLDFYNPDPAYVDLYRVRQKTSLKCSSIALELKRLGVSVLDFLKIDTQGSELDIIKGWGEYFPLIIQTEAQYLPMYHGVPTAYEVHQYLFDLGYVPFVMNACHRELCPVWGDSFFMPNWTDEQGISLIRQREEKYIALMLMFGQVKILKFVNRKIGLKHGRFIESLQG